MARRPKLRMTNADYVAIAASPALIMTLVGSLVFFLIEVLYVGQYHARLNYVFALFVFATVLIGRISIEMGAERAALFALPLGIAMFLVLAKFVQHSSPFSHGINLALLGIVWWSTHKLTWDCTLIDDSEDASGEGLMQRIGVDESTNEIAEEQGNTINELFLSTQDKAGQHPSPSPSLSKESEPQKTPHTPGLWVLYFSLAALPLFGIGQKWIPAGDSGRRQYAFGLLAVYVAAGLGLLVTTSFLGLRRYLRQRRIEMPTPMATTWVTCGGALIVVVMLLAALIPRPQAEYAISQVPWQARSQTDLAASRTSLGKDGTEDDDSTGRKITNEETDPDATATREGENPTTNTKEGNEQPRSGEGEAEYSSDSPSHQSEQAKQPGSGESSPADSQSEQPAPATESESTESEKSSPSDTSSKTPSEAMEDSRPAGDANSDSDSDSSTKPVRAPSSVSNFIPTSVGLAGIFKLLLYALVGIALIFLAWQNRREIAKALRDILQALRDFWQRLFGGGKLSSANVAEQEPKKPSGPPPRLFATYADPFASGQARAMPPDELVQYTFQAFEAWARERDHPRRPDQTPVELVRHATPPQSALRAEALQLSRLYNEAAYSPQSVSASSVAKLANLWNLLREARQTPLETRS